MWFEWISNEKNDSKKRVDFRVVVDRFEPNDVPGGIGHRNGLGAKRGQKPQSVDLSTPAGTADRMHIRS
jgi:hypothetical protein